MKLAYSNRDAMRHLAGYGGNRHYGVGLTGRCNDIGLVQICIEHLPVENDNSFFKGTGLRLPGQFGVFLVRQESFYMRQASSKAGIKQIAA